MSLRGLFQRFSGMFRRQFRDRELDAELESHLRMQTAENMARGMNSDEARRAALIRAGGIESAKETYRDRRGLPLIETTLQDIRFGLRVLWTSPLVTIVAIVTLALAIGVNTTVFSAVNAFLLRRPPVSDPDHLMVVSSVNPQNGAYTPDRNPVSPLDYLDWSNQQTSFTEMAATDSDDFTISGDAAPQRALGARVSPNFFRVLGVVPVLGRTFADDENQQGRNQVVILSNQLWQERFGGDPSVLDRAVKINGNPHTVVGVMPASFHPWGDLQSDLWVPLTFSADDLQPAARRRRSLLVLARLKPGIDERRAAIQMQTIAQRIAQSHKDTNENWGAHVMSLQAFTVADSNTETALVFLMAAVVFVLLIACTNLANLLLARNSSRQREFSIRSVLGAGRLRLARQLLTECLLLSLAGVALGIPFAFGALRAIQYKLNWSEYAAAMAKELRIDSPALVFTIAVSVTAAILFGLVPALQIVRREPVECLKEGGRGSTAGPGRSRVQHVLVVAQLALSLFLLVGAGLFVEGFIEEMSTKPGFDSHSLLTASVSLRGLEYLQPQAQKQFFENALRNLSSAPDVQSAALTSDLPFTFPAYTSFTIEGHPATKPTERPSSAYFAVSSGYFATTQISLLQGRAFTDSDASNAAPVAIVNQAFAARFFNGENPLGRHIRLERGDGPENPWSEIIGVSANIKEFLGQQKPRPQLFVPFAANPSGAMYFVVRTRANPANASDSVRRAVWAINGDQAVTNVRTMERVIADSLGGDDLMAEMMGSFAFIALIMAACGIFGVISYLVGQRTHEMGVRLALGSEPRQILRLVIGNGMKLVGIGTGIGFLVALALPKLFAASFDGFHMTSVIVLTVAPIVLIIVGFAASYIPARRAMRVDPMVALRYE